MAKAFVKKISEHIYKEFHATLPSDELELSFKEAIENLPMGKLKDSLNNNFSKHFKKLKKKLAVLCKTELPDLSTSVDESLQDVTAELDTRSDISDTTKPQHCMYYNVMVKPVTLPKKKDLASLSSSQKIAVYCGFLASVLDRQDIPEATIKDVVDELKHLLDEGEETSKNQLTWLPIVQLLHDIGVDCQPLATIRILRFLIQSCKNDVNDCILKKKPNRAGKLANKIKTFLTNSHLRVKRRQMVAVEGEKYGHCVAALSSMYIDMLCANYRKEAASLSKKQLGQQICGFVAFLLQPEYIPEVILGLNKVSSNTANIIFPLVRKCLSVKPEGQQHQYYLKYVLVVRMLKDEIGEENEAVKEWIVLTRTQVPAGPKFLDWLQDECPGAAEHLPVEDKKFKKIRVTRFLLEDASEEFKSLLLESLYSQEDGELVTETEDIPEVTIDTEEPSYMDGGLFYLDKGPGFSVIPETSESKSEPGSSGKGQTKKSPIVLKSIQDLEDIVDLDPPEDSEDSVQGFVIDPALISERVKDPEDQRFLQSEIISITSLDTSNNVDGCDDKEEPIKEKTVGKASRGSPQKADKSPKTKSKTPEIKVNAKTMDIKTVLKAGLDIMESETEIDESLQTSEDDHVVKSVVQKVDKATKKVNESNNSSQGKQSDSSVILVEDSDDEFNRKLDDKHEEMTASTENDINNSVNVVADTGSEMQTSDVETVSDIHENSVEERIYELVPAGDSSLDVSEDTTIIAVETMTGESNNMLSDNCVEVTSDVSVSKSPKKSRNSKEDKEDTDLESSAFSAASDTDTRRRSPRKKSNNKTELESSPKENSSKRSPVGKKGSSPMKANIQSAENKIVDLTESDAESGTFSKDNSKNVRVAVPDNLVKGEQTFITEEEEDQGVTSDADIFMEETLLVTTTKDKGQADSLAEKGTPTCKQKELHNEDESEDEEVFIRLPRAKQSTEKSKTEIEEKFIGKAKRSQKTPKKPAKPVQKSSVLEVSEKEAEEVEEKEDKRTKSTEEIITVVEEIKSKMNRQKKKTQYNKEEDIMFTDDSVESVDNTAEEENVTNMSEQTLSKEMPEKSKTKKSPRKGNKEISCRTQDENNESDNKTPKKAKKLTPKKADNDLQTKLDNEPPKESPKVESKTISDGKIPDRKTPKKSDSKSPKKSDSITPKKTDCKTPNKSESKTPKMSGNKSVGSNHGRLTPKKNEKLTALTVESSEESDNDNEDKLQYTTSEIEKKQSPKKKTPLKSENSDVIPSSNKKSRPAGNNKQNNIHILETDSDSDSDLSLIPNIKEHLKQTKMFEQDKKSPRLSEEKSPTKKTSKTPEPAPEHFSKSPIKSNKMRKTSGISDAPKTPAESPQKSQVDKDNKPESRSPHIPEMSREKRLVDEEDEVSPKKARRSTRARAKPSAGEDSGVDSDVSGPRVTRRSQARASSNLPPAVEVNTEKAKPARGQAAGKKAIVSASESELSDTGNTEHVDTKSKLTRKSVGGRKILDKDLPDVIESANEQNEANESEKLEVKAKQPRKSVGGRKSIAKHTLAETIDNTDEGEMQARPARKSAGGKKSLATDKASVSEARTEPQTPETNRNLRKLSASTSKKDVDKKVETLRGTRKRRLSSELSDQGNISTDSDVSFPKVKKVVAEKKTNRRLSSVPVVEKPGDGNSSGRRYSLRQK